MTTHVLASGRWTKLRLMLRAVGIRLLTLACFLTCTIACWAQRAEDQVLAVYRQMEKAEQNGDANT
jgi:hypothetical protein